MIYYPGLPSRDRLTPRLTDSDDALVGFRSISDSCTINPGGITCRKKLTSVCIFL